MGSGDLDRAALVECDQPAIRRSRSPSTSHQLDHAEDRAAELLLEPGDIAGVIAMTVSDRDRIGAFGFFSASGVVGPFNHGST